MRLFPIAATALALLAGCSESPTADAPRNAQATAETIPAGASDGPPTAVPTPLASETPTPDATNSPVPQPPDETNGGDGSPLVLLPLRLGDAADLSGELGCSFQLKGQRQPILIGRADVGADARAMAVVRIGDYVEELASRAEGGFGAMERGGSFGGRGLDITVERGARQPGEGEATTYQATLLTQRADGAERRFAGLWSCGP